MSPESNRSGSTPNPIQKAERADRVGVKLAIAGMGNLALSSAVTITLMFGMVLVFSLAIVFILDSSNPTKGLAIAIGNTLLFNIAAFFWSPLLMDWIQHILYRTRWVTLAEVERRSPEAAEAIHRVCQEHHIAQPRLGIINDQNPTAFTYGSLQSKARLVVSEGLFTYLDEDEVAAVYCHELGHIVHWDFAVMTLASTLVQITYLIYTFITKISRFFGETSIKDAIRSIASAAYIFYLIGTYLLLYLSRTREYFADRFAAETTGNPNALSRALVKIAYGIVEEGKRSKEPSRLMEGTRALGIFDAKAATSTGTAYRITADSRKIGRVFLWDLFNPWGGFMELHSTHPLTGKRVRALSRYAEQLGLETEFDLGRIIGEGRHLNQTQLYRSFLLDILLYFADTIGFIGGLAVASIVFLKINQFGLAIGCFFMCHGFGILLKTMAMYPNERQAETTDILSLMSDPYASPLRGKPAKLQGDLIGRGNAGYILGSELQLQDSTGLIFLRYASRFGAIGNLFFGMKRVERLIGMPVTTLGWFRRGVSPCMDLIQLVSESGTIVNSYHRFWSLIWGGGAMILGIIFAF